jgi:hypothetical protein
LGIPTTLTFLWRPAAGAVSYRFQLSTSSDYSALVRDTAGVVDTSLTASGLALNRLHYWRVRGVNGVGQSVWSSSTTFRTTTDVERMPGEEIPSRYLLSQNYPNPFNPATTLQFAVPQAERVTVTVYDMLGREVAVLVNDVVAPGRYTVTWNAEGLASGTYFCRMTAGSYVETKRMLLLR